MGERHLSVKNGSGEFLRPLFQRREASFERAEGALHVAEASEGRGRAQPLAVVEGGDAGDDAAGGDVVARGALGREHHVVADFEVTGDARLTGEDDAAADARAAGEPHLRAEEGVLADRARVADLDEVVDLGAARDARLADRGAVDGRARPYLDIVFDDDAARLRNLQPASLLVLRVPEAVGADDGVVVYGHAGADDGALAQSHSRVYDRAFANRHAAVDGHV